METINKLRVEIEKQMTTIKQQERKGVDFEKTIKWYKMVDELLNRISSSKENN
jgi:hypothetical protein